MTIYDLRKTITVHSYTNDKEGAEIRYYLDNEHLILTSCINTLTAELLTIGSIDKEEDIEGYKLSQWDALNIVIRHEYRNCLEAENQGMDIFGALANIINPTNK